MSERGVFIGAIIFALLLAACTSEIQPAQQPVLPHIEIVPPSTLPQKPKYEPPPTAPQATAVNEIKIEATLRGFLPNEITVKKGEYIRLIVTATDVKHTFMLPAYGIEEDLPLGEDVIIEFVANQEGTFQYSCIIPGHESMKGKLIVK